MTKYFIICIYICIVVMCGWNTNLLFFLNLIYCFSCRENDCYPFKIIHLFKLSSCNIFTITSYRGLFLVTININTFFSIPLSILTLEQ